MRPRRPPSTPTISTTTSTTAAQPRSRRTRSLLLAPAPDPRASPAAMIKHARPFGACGGPPLNLDPARQRRAAHLVVAPRAVPRRCRCRHHGHRPRRQPAASLLLRMRLRRRLQLQLRSRLRLRLRLVLPLRAARRGCPGRRASGVVGRRGGGRRGGAQGNPTAPGPFSIFADLLAGIRRDRGQAAVGREQATCGGGGGGRSPLELSRDGAPRGGPLTARRGSHRRRQPLAVSRAGAVVVGLGRARANLARGELRAVFPLRSVVAEGRPGVAEGGLHCVRWVAPCGTIRRPTLAVACPTPQRSLGTLLKAGERWGVTLLRLSTLAQRGDSKNLFERLLLIIKHKNSFICAWALLHSYLRAMFVSLPSKPAPTMGAGGTVPSLLSSISIPACGGSDRSRVEATTFAARFGCVPRKQEINPVTAVTSSVHTVS